MLRMRYVDGMVSSEIPIGVFVDTLPSVAVDCQIGFPRSRPFLIAFPIITPILNLLSTLRAVHNSSVHAATAIVIVPIAILPTVVSTPDRKRVALELAKQRQAIGIPGTKSLDTCRIRMQSGEPLYRSKLLSAWSQVDTKMLSHCLFCTCLNSIRKRFHLSQTYWHSER